MTTFRDRLRGQPAPAPEPEPTPPAKPEPPTPAVPPFVPVNHAVGLAEVFKRWVDDRIEHAPGNFIYVGRFKPRAVGVGGEGRIRAGQRTLLEDFERYTGRKPPAGLTTWLFFECRERGWPVEVKQTSQLRLVCVVGIKLVGQTSFNGNDFDPQVHFPRWLKKGIPVEEAKRLHSQRIAKYMREKRAARRVEREAARANPT